MKTPREVRQDYSKKAALLRREAAQAQQQKQHLKLLQQCSEGDKAAIEALAQIELMSGGQLDRLVATYKSIKLNDPN